LSGRAIADSIPALPHSARLIQVTPRRLLSFAGMNMRKLLATLIISMWASLAHAQKADLIVTNAKIATLDSASTVAQALAVREGRIVAVGANEAVEALAGSATRRLDAGGRTVIPGLIDSHIHAVRAGLTYATEVNWIGTKTIGEAMERLRQAAKARPGSWIIVATAGANCSLPRNGGRVSPR
jgi:urease alpha subunit